VLLPSSTFVPTQGIAGFSATAEAESRAASVSVSEHGKEGRTFDELAVMSGDALGQVERAHRKGMGGRDEIEDFLTP
jgi:hypothetical protein